MKWCYIESLSSHYFDAVIRTFGCAGLSVTLILLSVKHYKTHWLCEPVSVLAGLKLPAVLFWPVFTFESEHRASQTYSLPLCVSPSLILPSGLALWAAALEGGSLSGKQDALGEPLHDPPLPEPRPGRARRHLRAGEQRRAAAPQRAADAPDAHLQRPATGELDGPRARLGPHTSFQTQV